ETISFADWLAYRRRERTLPRRPIILTFDDGYRSTYEVAWPLLKRHHATASVFLVSDLIGKTNAWDADEIQQPLLDTRQIAAMRAGRIEFGSHTRTHPALTALPPDRVLAELRDSRTALEQLLDEPVRVLCYPYGKQTAAVRALAREAGYEAEVIARRRLNSHASDPLRLTRLRIDTTPRLPAARTRPTSLQHWFRRAPFAIVALSGLTPLPFFPFKALAFTMGYPLGRYLAAVATRSVPRYALLAWLGVAVRLPSWLIAALFV